MTREEKEQTGKYVLKMARLLEDGCWQQKMLLNAVHIIDEVLELESVLDKIRAEIEQLRLHKAQFITSDNKVCIDSQEILNIIDKYKGESENKE